MPPRQWLVGFVLRHQTVTDGLERASVCLGPPIAKHAVAIELAALVIETVADLVADHGADGPIVHCIVRSHIEEALKIPGKMEQILANEVIYQNLARSLHKAKDFLYLGRGIHFPIALEGALKLKEISYIHAEGYPAGEMKHGPNALIDENLPVVVLAAYDPEDPEGRTRYEKTVSNIQEVKARSGIVVAIANEGDKEIADMVDYVIPVPITNELLLPLLEIIPLQLLAYYIAVRLGCDVDQPRNLAKSVTVE